MKKDRPPSMFDDQPPPSAPRRSEGAASGTRPVRQLSEPARFWIAYGPRSWRAAAGPWTDLANGRLEGLRHFGADHLPELDLEDVDDLFYLPPVAPALVAERDRLAESLVRRGVPVVVELAPGERCAVSEARTVHDLLAPILKGEIEALAGLAPASIAVWPLIAGVSDDVELWEEGCTLLCQAGVRCVQPLALDLTPFQRRKLAEERDEEVFDALFHRPPPSEREFSRFAAGFGLEAFTPRPSAAVSRRRASNRRIAAELATAGELWLRLGRPASAGQALLRAARGAEASGRNVAALAREENLKVLDWLDKQSRDAVEEIAATGRSSLVEELLVEYLGTTAEN